MLRQILCKKFGKLLKSVRKLDPAIAEDAAGFRLECMNVYNVFAPRMFSKNFKFNFFRTLHRNIFSVKLIKQFAVRTAIEVAV